MERLKKDQKKMVAAVTASRGNSYLERLSEPGLSTLAARREMLDLRQADKIISEKEDLDPAGTWFKHIGERAMPT